MIKINIDLTAIANSKKYRKAKNEHNYIDLIVTERKEPDRDGNTLSVSISKSKEEREAKVDTIYVGAGKTFGEQAKAVPAQSTQKVPIDDNGEELPF